MSKVVDLAEASMTETAGRGQIFDLKVNYISSSPGDEDLRATSHVVHAGRRTIVAECRIEAPGERLVATASATFAVGPDEE